MKNNLKTIFAISIILLFFSINVNGNLTHNIKNDETLWEISKHYDVTINELLELNSNIKNPALIYADTELILPDNIAIYTSSTGITKENSLLALINEERKNNNLNPLVENDKLSILAQLKSDDMDKNNLLEHNSKKYNSAFAMLTLFEVDYKYAGENIAFGQESVEQVFVDWINNDNYNNILNNNFTDIGIAKTDNNYWTIIFVGN